MWVNTDWIAIRKNINSLVYGSYSYYCYKCWNILSLEREWERFSCISSFFFTQEVITISFFPSLVVDTLYFCFCPRVLHILTFWESSWGSSALGSPVEWALVRFPQPQAPASRAGACLSSWVWIAFHLAFALTAPALDKWCRPTQVKSILTFASGVTGL